MGIPLIYYIFPLQGYFGDVLSNFQRYKATWSSIIQSGFLDCLHISL
jgi:hypothetical protein